jgi:hypothetical protein
VSAAAPINLPMNTPGGITPAPAKISTAAKSNLSFRSFIRDLLTPAQTAGPWDAPSQHHRAERNPGEQNPGRASIAGMFTVQAAVAPPPVRLPLSLAGGEVTKDVADPSGARTDSSTGPLNGPGLGPSLPSANFQTANHHDVLPSVSTSAAVGQNLLQTELAFSAVLSPMQRLANRSLTVRPAMGAAAAVFEDVSVQAGGNLSDESQVPPHDGPAGSLAVPVGNEQEPAAAAPSDSSRALSASILPGAEPEPEKSQTQRTETTQNPATPNAAGRHSERPASVESDFDSPVRPAAAMSAPEDHVGTRPAFEFTPPGVAGSAPNKEPSLAQPQASQAPEPPEQPARLLQSPAVQNLQIRIGEDPTRLVELQVSEHAGNIHVAVRSADPELTVPLRLNLPGLVENLERRGYRAESLSVNEPGPMNTTHSEPKTQTEQNGSWTDSQNGGRGRDDSGTRNRRKRTSTGPETEFSLNPLQENNP